MGLQLMPTAWREFARFVRRPCMASPVGLRNGWRLAGAMLALNLLGLFVLLIAIGGWQALVGIDRHALEDVPEVWLLPAAVLAAPLVEEPVFRGWLGGRPRVLWLLGCSVAGAVLVAADPAWPLLAGGLVLLLCAGLVGCLMLWNRETPNWFVSHFPAIFFAGAGLFAIMHVFNYADTDLLTLPMVLPQLWAGLTLGFVRIRVGLPASMLVHGLSNGLLLAPALLEG